MDKRDIGAFFFTIVFVFLLDSLINIIAPNLNQIIHIGIIILSMIPLTLIVNKLFPVHEKK